jgi:hypothetical protein
MFGVSKSPEKVLKVFNPHNEQTGSESMKPITTILFNLVLLYAILTLLLKAN